MGACPLCGREQLLEERGGPRHVRAVFRHCERHRIVGVPALHQHGGGTDQQRTLEGVDGAADVRDRRGNQELVAGVDAPVIRDLGDERMDRIVRVENALGPSGGARGVHDHPDRIRVEFARGCCAVDVEQVRVGAVGAGVVAHHHDLRRGVHRGRHAAQHGGVVMAAEGAGHEDHPALGVVEDEAQFVVAQRRQDRVHHHPRQRRPEIHDCGLVPVGQHERHHTAFGHPVGQRRGQRACSAVQLATVHPNVAVDHDDAVRRLRRGVPKCVGQRATHPESAVVCLRGAGIVPPDRPSANRFAAAHHVVLPNPSPGAASSSAGSGRPGGY